MLEAAPATTREPELADEATIAHHREAFELQLKRMARANRHWLLLCRTPSISIDQHTPCALKDFLEATGAGPTEPAPVSAE